MQVNKVVKTESPNPEHMPRVRVTMTEIAEVRRKHIERNLLYSPEEAGQVLGKSARTILELVKDGRLIAADESAANGRKASNGLKVTAESLEVYRQSILVDPSAWEK